MRLTCQVTGGGQQHSGSEVGQDQPLRSVLNPEDLGLVLPLCVVLVQGLESETLSGERGRCLPVTTAHTCADSS